MIERAGRGSLSGRWSPRGDGAPNLTGGITIECDLPKGTKLWLQAWTRSAAGCDEFIAVVAKVATGGPRKARKRRASEATDEPEGVFRDAPAASSVPVLGQVRPEHNASSGHSNED